MTKSLLCFVAIVLIGFYYLENFKMDRSFIEFAVAIIALVATCATITIIGVNAANSVSCKQR